MKVDSVLGVDLGGTEIKSVSVSYPEGVTHHRASRPTFDGEFLNDGRARFVGEVQRLIETHESRLGSRFEIIGISAPGLADPNGECIRWMPGRMAGLEGTSWRQVLGRDHPIPVLNDAQAALLGENWLGAAKGLADVVMFTLGTGVGGAIVSGGRLLRGHFGRAGHLGHLSVDYRGEPDSCRTPGSIESAFGNRSIIERSNGRFSSTAALVAALSTGDVEATEIWMDSLRALAAAIVSITNAVDPEVVLLGGGITTAGDHLFGPLRDLVGTREWTPGGARVRLEQAVLGPWAGAYGAAYHAVLAANPGSSMPSPRDGEARLF